MNKIFVFLCVMVSCASACNVTMNSTSLINTSYNFTSDNCLYLEDLNATLFGNVTIIEINNTINNTEYINQTVYVNQTEYVYLNQTYPFINISLSINETYSSAERNFSATCRIPSLMTLNLEHNETYTNALRNFSAKCDSAPVNTTVYVNQTVNQTVNVCNLTQIEKNLSAGACTTLADRNVSVCAASCQIGSEHSFERLDLSLDPLENLTLEERNITVRCKSEGRIPALPAKLLNCTAPTLGWFCPSSLSQCSRTELDNFDFGSCIENNIATYVDLAKSSENELNATKKDLDDKNAALKDANEQLTLFKKTNVGLIVPVLIITIVLLVGMLAFKVYNIKVPALDTGRRIVDGEKDSELSAFFKDEKKGDKIE